MTWSNALPMMAALSPTDRTETLSLCAGDRAGDRGDILLRGPGRFPEAPPEPFLDAFRDPDPAGPWLLMDPDTFAMLAGRDSSTDARSLGITPSLGAKLVR